MHTMLSISCGLVAAATLAGAGEPLRYDFGATVAAPGWVRVGPDTLYGEGQPYGLHPGTSTQAAAAADGDDPQATHLTGHDPFFFSVDVPDGNYRVTVHVGDVGGTSLTTIKAEARRPMIRAHETHDGVVEPVTFCVNMRTPALADGGRVSLNQREYGHPDWDQRLTLEFSDRHPCIAAVEIEPVTDVVTLYLLGDSTVTDQRDEPWCAWGQMLPQYFSPTLAVANHAESGRTLDSFRGQKRLQKVLETLRSGDFVFLQFGHNDMKQKGEGQGPFLNFRDNLHDFVAQIRAREATPVLFTPMHRRRFDDEGHIIDTFGEYPDATRQAAAELGVPLVDLHRDSRVLFEALGKEGSLRAFVHYPANSFPGQEEPLKDDSHFSPYGADQLARIIVEHVNNDLPGLAAHLRSGIPAYDPAQPDAYDAWHLPTSPLFDLKPPEGS